MNDESVTKRSILKVGYALNSKKLRAASVSSSEEVKEEDVIASVVDHDGPWCGGGLATIVGASLKSSTVVDGVVFTPINAEGDGNEDIDIILHKLTGDIVKANEGYDSPRLKIIKKILEKNPTVEIVDRLESVGLVVSRFATSTRIANLINGLNKKRKVGMELNFNQPKFSIVGDENDKPEDMMRSCGLRFPVICKPERACGVAESHYMNVVLDVDGFNGIPRPFIMQQYHNHDSVYHKVYVIGDCVMMFRRPSLPNFSLESGDFGAEGGAEKVHVIPFDSRRPYPTLNKYHGRGITVSDACVKDVEACSQDQVEELAHNLGNSFGLSLFGFDMVVPSCTDYEDRLPLIVDVNFFPSYKEVPNFPHLLRAHLRRKAGFPSFEQH